MMMLAGKAAFLTFFKHTSTVDVPSVRGLCHAGPDYISNRQDNMRLNFKNADMSHPTTYPRLVRL